MNLTDVLCPGLDLRTACPAPKEPGALVMIGRNHGPVYKIVAVHGEQAWLEGVGIASLDRLRVVGTADLS